MGKRMIGIWELVKDPYERKARVTPGLLVALPLLVPLVAVYGAKHPILTGVLALLGGCGAIFTLANIARGLGKRTEERLIAKWGGMPTTLALRHRETHLDGISKNRYHEAIQVKLGIPVPTAEQEAQSPVGADDVYIGATKRIRELTRGNKQLLLKENIAYGFHRNMVGLKPVGILTTLTGIAYGLFIAGVVARSAPHFRPENLMDPGLASGVTMLVSLALLAAWIFYFTPNSVWRVGLSYAERLFECLVELRTPSRKKASTTTS